MVSKYLNYTRRHTRIVTQAMEITTGTSSVRDIRIERIGTRPQSSRLQMPGYGYGYPSIFVVPTLLFAQAHIPTSGDLASTTDSNRAQTRKEWLVRRKHARRQASLSR